MGLGLSIALGLLLGTTGSVEEYKEIEVWEFHFSKGWRMESGENWDVQNDQVEKGRKTKHDELTPQCDKAGYGVTALEYLGGTTCGVSASYFLTPRSIEWLPEILFVTLVVTPLASTVGISIMGNKLGQEGSFAYSLIGAVLGSAIWWPFGDRLLNSVGLDETEKEIDLFMVGFGLSSSIGALIGYNKTRRR